jgi:hypothetical protein
MYMQSLEYQYMIEILDKVYVHPNRNNPLAFIYVDKNQPTHALRLHSRVVIL